MMSETGHLNFKKRRRKFDIRPDKTNFGGAFKKLLCGCLKSRNQNEDSKNIKRFDNDIKFDDSKASPLYQNITREFFEQELAKCFNKTSLKVFNNPKVDNKKSLLAISSNDTLGTQCLSAATFFSTSFFQVSTPLQYQTYPISVNYYHHSPADTTDRACQYELEDNNDKTTSTKHAVADQSTQVDSPRLPPLLIQKIIKCLDLMSSSEPLDQTLQTSPVLTCNKETNTGGNLKSTTVLFANHGNMVESSDEQASGRFNYVVKTKKKKCLRYTSPVNEAKRHCCTSTSDTCMYTEVQAKFQEWLQFMQKTKKVSNQGVQQPEYHQANSTQTRVVPTDLERKEAISKVAEFLTSENPLLTEDIQKSFNKLAAYREGRHKADLQNQKYPSFIVTEKCKLCEGKRQKLPKIIIEKKKKKTKEDVDPLSEKFVASLSDNGLQKVDEHIAEITSEIKQFLKTMVDDISDINIHGDQNYDFLESGSSKDDSLNSLLTTDLELQPFGEEFFTMFNSQSPATIVPLLHEFDFLPTESNATTVEKSPGKAQKKSKKGAFSKKKPLVADSSATKSSVTTQSAICIKPEPSDWLDDVLMTYDKEVNATKYKDFEDVGNMAGTSSCDLTHQGTMAGRSMFTINDKATNTGDEFSISKGIQASKGTSNKKLYVFKERKSVYDIGSQTLPAYGEDLGTIKIYPNDEKIMYARDRKKAKKVTRYIKRAKTLVRGILQKGRYCDSFTNTEFADDEEETEQVVIAEEESSEDMPERDVRVKFSNIILQCDPDGSRTQISLPNKPTTGTVSRCKPAAAETTVLSIFSAVYNHKQALFSKKNDKAKQNLFGFCKFGGGDGLDIFTMPTNLFTYPVITNKICTNLSKSSDFDPKAPKKKKPRRKLRRYRKPPRIKNPTGGKGTSSDEASKGKKKKNKKFRKKRKKTQMETKFSDQLENPDQEQLARELANLREREGQQSIAEISTLDTNTTNDKDQTKGELVVIVSTPSSTKTEEETSGQEVKQRPSGFKLLPKIFRRRKNTEKKGKFLKNSVDVRKITPNDNTTTKEKENQKKGIDKEEDQAKADKQKEGEMRKGKKKEDKMKKDKKKKDKKEDKMIKAQKKKDQLKKHQKKKDKDEEIPDVDKPDHVCAEVNPESPADVNKLIITLMKKPESQINLGDSTTTSSLHKLSSAQTSQQNVTEVLEETSESNIETKEALEKNEKKEPKKNWWNLWKKKNEITATRKKSSEKETLGETTWLKIPIGSLELTGTETEEANGKESEDIDTEEGNTERKKPQDEDEPEQADIVQKLEDEHAHKRYLIELPHTRSFPPMRGILPMVPELTAVANRNIYNIHAFVGQSTTSNLPSRPFSTRNSFILVHEGGPSFESAQLSLDQRLIGSSSESSDDYLFRTEGEGETWTRMRKALLKSGIRQHISEDSNILLYPTYDWRKFQTPSQLQFPAGVLSVEGSSETESVGKFSFEELDEEDEQPGAKFFMEPFDEEEEFDDEGQPIHKEHLPYDKLMGDKPPMNMLSEVRIDYNETGRLATSDLQNILDHLAEDHYDIMNARRPPKEEEFVKQIEAASEFSILPKTEEQRVNAFESSLANVGKPIEEIDQDLDDYLKTIGFYQPKAIGVYRPEHKAIGDYPIAQIHRAIGDDQPQPAKPQTLNAFTQPDFTVFLNDDHRNLKEGLGKIKDIDLMKNAFVKVNTGQAQLFVTRSDPFAHMKNVRVTYLGNSFLVTVPEEMLSPTLEWCMTHKKVKEGVQALLAKNAEEVQAKLLAKLAKGKKSVYSGADDEDTLYTLQALVALAELNAREAKKLSIFFAGICPNTKSDFMEVISRMKSEDAKSVFSAFSAMTNKDIRDTLEDVFNIENKHAQTAFLLKIAKEVLKKDVGCECKIPMLIVPKKQKAVMAKVENQSKNVGTDAAPIAKKKDAGTDMKVLKKEESVPKMERIESKKMEVYPEPEPTAKIERPDIRNKQTDVKPAEGKPVTRLERPDIRDKPPGDEKSTEFKPIARVERPDVRTKQSPETSKEGGLLPKVAWPDVKSCLFPGLKSADDDPLPKLERSDVSTGQTRQKPTEDKSMDNTMEMPPMRRRPTGYTSTEDDPWREQTYCRLKEDPQYQREDPEYKREDPQYKREDPQSMREDPQYKREDPQYKREDPQNKKDEPQRDGSRARREEWILKVERPGVRTQQSPETSKEGGLLPKVAWPDVKSCLFPGRKSVDDDPLPKPERSDVSTGQTRQKPTDDKSTMEMPPMRRRPTGYTSTEDDPWGEQTYCRLKEDPQYQREDPEYKREGQQYKREDPQSMREDPQYKREDPQYKREDPQNKKDEPQRDGSRARREEWILKVLTPSEEGIDIPLRHQYTQSSVPPSPHHSRTPSRSSTPVTCDLRSGEVQTDETTSWPTAAAIARVRKRLIPSFYKRDHSEGKKENEFWSKIKEKRIPEKLGLIKKKDSCDKCCQIKDTKPVDRNILSLLGNRRSLRRKDRRKLAEDIAKGLSEDAETVTQQTSPTPSTPSTPSTQSTPWSTLNQSKTTQYVHHQISPYPTNKGHSLHCIDNLGSSTQSSSVGKAEIPTSSVTVTSETSHASQSDDLLNMIKKGNIMLDKEELAGVLSRKYRMPSPLREMSLFQTMAKVNEASISKQPNKKGMQIKLHGDTYMSCPRERSNPYAVGRSLIDDLLLKAEEELAEDQKKVGGRPRAVLTLTPLKKTSQSHSAITDGSRVAMSPSFLSPSKSAHAVCIGLASERKTPFRNMFKAATNMLDRVNRFHQPMLDPLVKSNVFARRKRVARTPSSESIDSTSSGSLSRFSKTSWSSSTRTDLSTKTIESSEYSCGICENHCQTEGLCYCRVSRSRNKSKHSRPVETAGKSTRDFANHYQAEIKPYTCCAHSKKVTWRQAKEQPRRTASICSNNELSSVTSIEKVKNQLVQGKKVGCPYRRSEYEEANSKLSVCKFIRKKKAKPGEGTIPKDRHGFFSKFFSKRKKTKVEDDHHDEPQPISKPELQKEPDKLKICSSCRSKLKSTSNSPGTSNDSLLKMAKADIQQEKTLKQETTPKRRSWSILGRKKADPAKTEQPKARSMFMVRRHERSKAEEPQPELAVVKDSMCKCPPHPNATDEQRQKRCTIKRIPSSIHRKAKRIEDAPKVEEPSKESKPKHHFGDVFRHHPTEPCGCEPGHPEYPIVKKKSCCSKLSCASPNKTPLTSEESTTSVKDCTADCRGFVERVHPATPKSSRSSLRKSAKSSRTSVRTTDEASRKHSLNSILKKQHEKHDLKKKQRASKKAAEPKKAVHHHRHFFRHHEKVGLTDPSPSDETVSHRTKKKKTCSSCGKKKPDKHSKDTSRESLCKCGLARLGKRHRKKKKCSSCGKPKRTGEFGSTDSVCMCDYDTSTRKRKLIKTKKTKKQNKKNCSTCGKKKKHGKLSSKSSLCKCDLDHPNCKQTGCSTCGKNKKSCASTSKESLCHCDSLPRKVKPPPPTNHPQKTSNQKSCSTCGKKKPTTPMDSSTDFCKCGSQTSIRSSGSGHKRHISMRHTPRHARSRPSSPSELSEHSVEERLLCECTYSKFDVRHAEMPIVDIYSKVEGPPTKEEVFQTLISMLMKRPRHKRYESSKRRKIKEYLSKVSSTELEDIVVEMVEQLPIEVRELIARMHKAQQTFLARKKGYIKYNASNSYFKKFNQAKTFNQPNRTGNCQSETTPTSSMELPSSKYWKYDFYPNKDNYSIDIDQVEVFCKARSSNCMENASFTTNYGVSVSLGGDEAEEAMEIIKLLSKLSPRNLCQFFSKQYN